MRLLNMRGGNFALFCRIAAQNQKCCHCCHFLSLEQGNKSAVTVLSLFLSSAVTSGYTVVSRFVAAWQRGSTFFLYDICALLCFRYAPQLDALPNAAAVGAAVGKS